MITLTKSKEFKDSLEFPIKINPGYYTNTKELLDDYLVLEGLESLIPTITKFKNNEEFGGGNEYYITNPFCIDGNYMNEYKNYMIAFPGIKLDVISKISFRLLIKYEREDNINDTELLVLSPEIGESYFPIGKIYEYTFGKKNNHIIRNNRNIRYIINSYLNFIGEEKLKKILEYKIIDENNLNNLIESYLETNLV